MANPNKPSRFLQEIKRRNVHRLMAVYGGTAFIIFEASTMIFPRWNLPDWTIDMVLYLLILGAIITFILGWIYDIHPEGGMVRTEPANTVKTENTPKSSNSWKIASYISFVVILGLIVLNVISRANKVAFHDKSIAVLPFGNDSPDSESESYIKGYCTSVHSNLCRIKDLRVLNLLSTEQYKNEPSSIPEIAKELGVRYVLSARGQIINNRVRLTVYLTNASDIVIWSNPYDRKIEMVDDHINIQSEIAQLVAKELQAAITPDEETLIKKSPTNSLTAYDLYIKADEYQQEYITSRDFGAYETAVNLYRLALETDPTFARAYTGLARAYYHRNYWPEFFTENFLDSCLLMVNKALSIDNKLDEAYFLRGNYFRQIGDLEEALINYDQAININPNFYKVYQSRGSLFISTDLSDNVKGLENLSKALSLSSIEDRPGLLRNIGGTLNSLGFFDLAQQYFKEAYDSDGNMSAYLWRQVTVEFNLQNHEEALQLVREAFQLDTMRLINLHFFIYTQPMHIEEAYKTALKVIKRSENTGVPYYYQSHRIGYIFYKMGKTTEAEKYFTQQIRYSEESMRLKRFYAQWKHAPYDLSATYAFLGDIEKAYQLLDEINARKFIDLGLISFIEGDPLYTSIHHEERFHKILQDMKSKNKAEHERVRQWLEENDML